MRPFQRLLAKTLAPRRALLVCFRKLGRIRPRVGIVPIVVAEPGKISPPILGAAFSLRIHRKWSLQHYSLVVFHLTG